MPKKPKTAPEPTPAKPNGKPVEQVQLFGLTLALANRINKLLGKLPHEDVVDTILELRTLPVLNVDQGG